MENQKNNKGVYVVIAILCVLVLLLGGYIVYDKVLENDTEINENNNDMDQGNDVSQDNNVTNQDNNNVNQDNDNNNTNHGNDNKWMDYIIDTNISSIKLNYCVDDPSNDMGSPTKKTIDITKNDLNRIFTEMKKGTISKNYYGGLGGPCMTSIDVDYTTNNKQYELVLVLYKFVDPEFTKDQKVLSYLEDTNYTIKKYNDDIDLNTEPYMFEYTYNKDIIDTIIDEYTK